MTTPRTYKRSCRTCGWTGTYTSPKRGDYAKRIHSCNKHTARTEATARNTARMAAIDRTPQPCNHKIANHQHGTYAAYTLDSCRCLPCSHAASEYEIDRQKRHAYGRFTTYSPAEPVRQHVRDLMTAGIGLKTIAKRSGVSQGSLWKLVYGKRKADGTQTPSHRVKQATADRLLALDPNDTSLLADGAQVDALITRRKLQALVALGWSQAKLADRLDQSPGNFGHTLHDNPTVLASTERAVAALYDELSMQVPPADEWRAKIARARSIRYAQERYWFPPLAWDDIDDPSSEPEWDHYLQSDIPDVDELVDDIAIERALAGDKEIALALTDAERTEAVRRWQATGGTLAELERRVGWNVHRHTRKDAA